MDNLIYEIEFDFKGEKVGHFDVNKVKEKLLDLGDIVNISYNSENVPSFYNLDPEALYMKVNLSLKSDFDIKIHEIDEALKGIVKPSYYTVNELNELDALNKVFEDEVEEEKKVIEKTKKIEKKDIKVDSNDNDNSEKIKEKTSIRVDTKKLDNLVNVVGELTVAHSSLKNFRKFISEEKMEEFEGLISELDNITKSMQEDVFSIRMVPIGNNFMQFKRMVRDISRKLNKKINFDIKGGETELDKTIIEKLLDPVRHMIRNSVDHGIETKEARIKSGKPEEGSIKIEAYQQGGEVIIEIFDDGKGLDKEKLLEKAIKKGIIEEGRIVEEEEIFMLIFAPGFSTKEEVTEISGRGVGMDVVKNNIEELSGKIEIESQKGKFTRFKIRLPLTLAIIDGMFVRVGENVYALPVLSISESLQPKGNEIKSIKGQKEVIDIRGEYFPVVKLSKIFGLKGAEEDIKKSTIIVIETYKGKMALMVDEVIDTQQIVIKKLNLSNEEMKKFSGATILGNGDVALILDVKNIYDSIFKKL